jgi:serine/threonine protein kinase/WD40 repeat protein
MPADPKRVKEIFLAVSDAADDRAALLDRECGGDADLRQRVEALLHAHHDPATFLRQRPESTVDRRPLPGLLPGQTFAGRFKLREELGHGGMGVVFVADQTEPVQRRVALKVIREGGDTARLLARFEQERQALALMDHPNIAKVFDAGVSDGGQPYFVMELIKGMPITDYCDKAKLTPRERLELFVPVCHAVQHAHQKGVIHRDLKPSNILVGLYDGKPVPKVIDFGVAKATGQRLSEASVYTEVGSVIGTLEYMSPEQAELNNLDIDTRSDVYALGVILYQLLTGTVPFSRQELQSRGFAEMLRIIKEKEPPRPSNRLSTSQELPQVADLRRTEPSKLSKLVRGELDWIVMKALEKDRTRRYETANGFAADVQRYLSGEPVQAVPPSVGYRLAKAYRKNKPAVWVGCAFALLMAVGVAVSSLLAVRATHAERVAAHDRDAALFAGKEAAEQRDSANTALAALAAKQQEILSLDYSVSMRQANSAWKENRFTATRTLLDKTRPELRGWEWHYLNRQCLPGERVKLTGSHERMELASYSPDGRWIAAAGATDVKTPDPSGTGVMWSTTGRVQIWDTTTLKPFTLCDNVEGLQSVTFSPDSRSVLVVERESVTIWDRETRTPLRHIPVGKNQYPYAAFSPDGKRIVTMNSTFRAKADEKSVGILAVWNAETGEQIWSQVYDGVVYYQACYDPTGRWVFVSLWKAEPDSERVPFTYTMKIFDAESHAEVSTKPFADAPRAILLNPNGTRLLTHSVSGTAKVWKVRSENGRPVIEDTSITLGGHGPGIVVYAFSPDGTRVVTAGNDGTVRVWDPETGRLLRTLMGHAGRVCSVGYSPDGRQIVTAGGDHTVRIWDAQEPVPPPTIEERARVFQAQVNRTGDRVLTTTFERTAVWDTRTGKRLPYQLPGFDHVFSPDGRAIACVLPSAGDPKKPSNTVGLHNADTGALIHQFEIDAAAAYRPEFSADGTRLLVKGRSRGCDLWNLKTRKHLELERREIVKGHANAGFSPDGTKVWLELMGEDSLTLTGIAIFDADTGRHHATLNTGPIKYFSHCGTLSADGTEFMIVFIAEGGSLGECRVWNVSKGDPVREFPVDARGFDTVEFSPDTKRLVTGNSNRTVVLDTQNGNELLSLQGGNWVGSVKFDPAGEKLVIADGRKVLILDGTPLPEAKK